MMNPFVGFLAAHSQLAIPLWFAISFYVLFQFADNHLAKSIKGRFSAYLLSARYETEFPNLAVITATIFRSVFSDRHLSWKCVKRSIIFSTLSLLSLLVFTFLYNPNGAISTFRMNIRNSYAAGITIALFSIWTFWCLIPDYLSLAKTRAIIALLSTRQISFRFGVAVIFSDFIAGSLLFLLVFSLAQNIAAFGYVWWLGKLPPLFRHATSDISMATVAVASLVMTTLIIEALALLSYGNLYYVVPYADLFWASMWPSAWMWFYIALSILARKMIRLLPVTRRVVSALDFEDHAFRELGLVGAILIAVVGYVVLGAITLKGMI